MTAERFIGPVNRAYEKAVRWSLRKRWVVAAATLASIAVAVFLYTRAETGFLPEMDEGGFVLDMWTPPGTSLAETDRIFHLVGEQVQKTPETEAFLRRTGAEMGPFATTQNTGEIVVKLKPRSQRERSIYETMDDLRQKILSNIPGVRVEFTQVLQDMIGDMEGNPNPIEVKIFGSNMPELEKLADEIGPKMQQIPGIVDFQGILKGNPEIVVHVDPVQAGHLGLTVDQVSQQVGAGLLGLTETELRQTDRTIGIRVRFPDSFRYNYPDVQQFPILTPGKQIVPVSALAETRDRAGRERIDAREPAPDGGALGATRKPRLGQRRARRQEPLEHHPIPGGDHL